MSVFPVARMLFALQELRIQDFASAPNCSKKGTHFSTETEQLSATCICYAF